MKYLVIYQTENDPYIVEPYITEARNVSQAKRNWVNDHPDKYKSWNSYVQKTREVDVLTVFKINSDQGDLEEEI